MKKILLLTALCLSFVYANAQFTATLAGNPVDITGWTMGAESSINGGSIKLTIPIGNQSGYIYYSTPVDLTTCSQFTVDYDFQVIAPFFAQVADGIAFWYISNPPTSFTSGGGCGLPTNPNGLIFILDTYDNNSPPTNTPLATLLGYDGTTLQYTEGSPVGQLGTVVPSLNYVTDGSWHHVKITYNNGAIAVYLNGSATASITGNYPLSMSGYFGFSASTGAAYSTQSIENVVITANAAPPQPVVTPNVTYCQNDVATALTSTGTNVQWYATLTGGTPFPTTPIPNTSVPGTTTYYAEDDGVAACPSLRDSTVVTVNPIPAPPAITGDTIYCQNVAPTPLIATGANVLWYTAIGGTGSATAPVVSTAAAGSTTYYATETVNSCISPVDSITVNVSNTVTPTFTDIKKFGCTSDTVYFINSSTFATSYTWTFGDGGSDNTSDPMHVYGSQGTYNVTLTGTNGVCTGSVTQSIALVHPLAAAFAVAPDTICVGQNITSTDGSTGGGLNYTWSFGDGTGVSSVQSPVHTYTQSGIFTIGMNITDSIGCQDSAKHNIYVEAFSVLASLHDTTVCLSTPMGLGAQIISDFANPANIGYTWNPGTGIDNPNTQFPNFYIQGDYTITVTATDLVLGCNASDVMVIHSEPPITLFNVTADQTVVLGDSVMFHAEGAAFYFWSPNDGTIENPNIANPYVIPVRPTTYTVYGMSIFGCLDSAKVNVNIDYTMHESIPNAFTPNGDGLNDVFHVLNLKYQRLIDFRVFNRWGQLVFHSNGSDGKNGWDGTFQGVPQDMGVYNYMIIVARPDGTEKTYTGDVTLVR